MSEERIIAGLDVEIFVNCMLVVVKEKDSGQAFHLWDDDEFFAAKVRDLLKSKRYTYVTFNGRDFDIPILALASTGAPVDKIKAVANDIITNERRCWETYRMHGLKEPEVDHIDLIEVSPASFSSLKSYGARMHMPWLKDLPFHHEDYIYDEQKPDIYHYCVNDVDTTLELYRRQEKEIALRVSMGQEYGEDFRSKSDSQMAEAAFIRRLGLRRRENKIPDSVGYKAPGYIQFEHTDLQELLTRIQDHEYLMNKATGHVILPDFLGKAKIEIGSGRYQTGVGGLHSMHNKKSLFVASEDYIIADIDAASFYPTIMITLGMIPQNTGQRFIDEYRKIYERRLAAKASGDKSTAETLKICLNGTFGKTASRWSPLYSPDLMIAITLTGQLTLLTMIEQIVKLGGEIIQANTDGITIGAPKPAFLLIQEFVQKFSKVSQFTFEYTYYRCIAMRDVNSYIAVKQDRSVKAKGAYEEPNLKKNVSAEICCRAVKQWLAHGIPLTKTISEGKFTDFLCAKNVTGGAMQGDQFLGRVARWYYSDDRSLPPITYGSEKKFGHKVGGADGCRAAMIIDPDKMPSDLDWEWYRKEAINIAIDVGASEYLSEEELKLVAPPPKEKKTKARKTNA